MSFKENLILSLYLVIVSLILFELSYFLNFTIFSPLMLINKYVTKSIWLCLLIEVATFYLFYLIYNQITSYNFMMFNHIYKYIVFGIIDYFLINGLFRLVGILSNYKYFTTQLCLFSGLIIIKCVNLYSIFYSNLIKYQRNTKKEMF